MKIDQIILDVAIELNNKMQEFIQVNLSKNSELSFEIHKQSGILYHELVEMCNCDFVLASYYKLLGEALSNEDYTLAEILKKQIETIEPLTKLSQVTESWLYDGYK